MGDSMMSELLGESFFAWPGANLVFIGLVFAIAIVSVYLGRTFEKKI